MSITWNGVSSDTIGVIVERIPNRYVPTRRFSPQQVAGRNGNILLVDKAFPNVEQEYEVYLSAEAQGLPSVARACAEWLMGPDGYCRLEDSYDTTVYREAFLMGGYDLENILNKFGRCTITFSCKPQKYLLTGDTPIEIPAGITTYTGDVVQFDGVTGASITSLSTTITPTQDLHGYSNPWPAGGGKNKLNNKGVSATVSNVAYTVQSDGSVQTSGTSNGWNKLNLGNQTLPAGEYIMSSGVSVKYQYNQFLSATINGTTYETNNGNVTFTLTAEATFAVGILTRPGTAPNQTVYPMIRLASVTDATFAPYSNICPITGRTGVNVWDDPKYGGTVVWNQLRPDSIASGTSQGIVLTFDSETGEVELSGTSTTTYRNFFSRGPLTLNHKYALIMDVLKNPNNVSFHLNAFNAVTTGTFSNPSTIAMCRLERETTNIGIEGFTANTVMDGIVLKFNIFDLTAMFGSTIADYIYSLEQNTAGAGVAWFRNLFPKPYYSYNAGETTCVSAVNGDPYWKKDIDWSSHGTVYGGTLDVVTGELVVNYKKIDLGNYNYGKSSDNNFYISTVTDFKAYGTGTTRYGLALCDSFAFLTGNWASHNSTCTCYYNAGYNGYRIFFHSEEHANDSIAQFKAYMQSIGASFVYELATPLTYQLTPQEIEVLVGKNNVWTSSGPVSVTVEAPFAGIVTNPTPFEARPMLEVSGVGEITINGKTIQILESVSDFDIDCESMEAEDNSKIYCMDFPELSGGENEIVGDGSITALTVTPRWWTL